MMDAIFRRMLCFSLCALMAGAVMAQEMYRWTDADGKVHYSDQPPPKEAKNVQQKKFGGNVIETDTVPYSTQVAQKRNPVTLYAFDCGDVCNQARALLRSRGIPFKELDTRVPANGEKLKQISGGMDVPVLQLGDIVVTGFEAGRWNNALNDAGYAQSGIGRVTSPAKAPATPAGAAGEAQAAEKGALPAY
jgi:glutaredoxin